MKKKDPEVKNNEERIFIEDRIISKRLKNGNISNETEALMKSARKAERLDEENEIVITILSEITNLPKEKVIYNYSEDISMTGTRIQGNVLLPIDTFLKIDLVIKKSETKDHRFWKSKTE